MDKKTKKIDRSLFVVVVVFTRIFETFLVFVDDVDVVDVVVVAPLTKIIAIRRETPKSNMIHIFCFCFLGCCAFFLSSIRTKQKKNI